MVGLLFNPQGRIGQGAFWIGWAVLLIGNIVTNFIPVVGMLLSIALIYMGVCVYGKRLHDMGKSAWLILVPWIANIVLALVGVAMMMPTMMRMMEDPNTADEFESGNLSPETLQALFTEGGAGGIVILLSVLVWLGFTLWVGLAKGDPGPNRFGPTPDGVKVGA